MPPAFIEAGPLLPTTVSTATMEKSDIPITKTTRRRRPLSSRTVDTLLHILSLCYHDSSPVIQNSNSDKPVGIDVALDCTDSIPNELFSQEKKSMDETQVVRDTQEDCSYNKHVESAEHDHNILGEKDLLQKVNTNPSVNGDIRSQDNYDMICSSPNLPTNGGAEEGEISGEFMDVMPEIVTGETNSQPRDFIRTKTGVKNDGSIIPLISEAVENGGTYAVRVVNKTTRSLVDYSEIAVDAKSQEPAKQATLKINATKNHVKGSDAQNNKKRKGPCTKEDTRNKKSKKSVDPITCPENITLLGEHVEDASQEVVASANKEQDACNEKKKKRVVTKERRAKKKIKERIKRAEKNRKLGIKRLKLQPVIKEKKITYCRHYMNGRCYEGEKCKFSHDTIPLTKSKPCCHFARHTCMKGDNCPYDHQLSKYPCNNYQTTGSCNRGSDCMFSHEAQPNEDFIKESNKSNPEQKPPPNSGSKAAETKSCSVPKFVDITPKSTRPPKGMNFLSQEKLPSESRPPKGISFLSQEKLSSESQPPKGISFFSQEKLPLESGSSPKVDSEVKEMTKTPLPIQDSEEKMKGPTVVHDSEGITKTPTVVPRGINFLSFCKKPGLDYANGGYSFRISNRVEKPRLSYMVSEDLKPGSTANVVNEVKDDRSTDGPNSSRKPMPVLAFMSSTSQKAIRSTLAFACELDSGVKSKV